MSDKAPFLEVIVPEHRGWSPGDVLEGFVKLAPVCDTIRLKVMFEGHLSNSQICARSHCN